MDFLKFIPIVLILYLGMDVSLFPPLRKQTLIHGGMDERFLDHLHHAGPRPAYAQENVVDPHECILWVCIPLLWLEMLKTNCPGQVIIPGLCKFQSKILAPLQLLGWNYLDLDACRQAETRRLLSQSTGSPDRQQYRADGTSKSLDRQETQINGKHRF